jgi:hypothetical protein
MPIGFLSPRANAASARAWVIRGLAVPDRIVTHEKVGGHGGFELGIEQIGLSGGGGWEKWYVKNPKAEMADTLIQLFSDANVTWDPFHHFWRLGREYHDDYEWARSQDRFRFFLAFYQDPFPDAAR